jgi:very-short-patch-repair endonuclease
VGKFGILEVDGRPYHQTAADDHERDRLFKRYGIRVIERFDATRCWNEPDKVVQEFLEILSSS